MQRQMSGRMGGAVGAFVHLGEWVVVGAFERGEPAWAAKECVGECACALTHSLSTGRAGHCRACVDSHCLVLRKHLAGLRGDNGRRGGKSKSSQHCACGHRALVGLPQGLKAMCSNRTEKEEGRREEEREEEGKKSLWDTHSLGPQTPSRRPLPKGPPPGGAAPTRLQSGCSNLSIDCNAPYDARARGSVHGRACGRV